MFVPGSWSLSSLESVESVESVESEKARGVLFRKKKSNWCRDY